MPLAVRRRVLGVDQHDMPSVLALAMAADLILAHINICYVRTVRAGENFDPSKASPHALHDGIELRG